jgi:hypothetical protein
MRRLVFSKAAKDAATSLIWPLIVDKTLTTEEWVNTAQVRVGLNATDERKAFPIYCGCLSD